jgi:hypothetical protein
MIDRRTLLKAGLAAVPLASSSNADAQAAAPLAIPWQRKIRRVGQLNMTEHDPAAMNVEEWADYWASLKVDAVLVSVTGILAFYQTKVPFHRKGKFLGNRDFFGECCAAAKKRGIHVIARMSPDLNWEDAVQAHPEWFQRNAQGNVARHGEDPRLFRTCMFTTYMTEYIPAIMREINSLYDVDGHFTNAWPPLGNLPVCYCEQCKNLPRSGTPAYWDKFNERVVYLWKLYDSIAKEKNPASFYFANLGGGIHSGPNLKQLGELCEWFQCDNQGRGGDDTPIWGCALQGRVCNAVQKGKMSANVTGAWSTGAVRWRNVHKSTEEAQMWMNATLASGMVPYYHWIGAENGMGDDRRWLEPGRQYFQWTAKHDRHFTNKRSIANLGVVMGQRTHLFYTPPRGATTTQFIDGMYYALLEGRFLFDFVHEDNLAPEDLKKYSALVLPNTALLSDEQCRQLRAYVDSGGSLLATFETSMYNERNERRADFGLADVFGIRKAGDVQGTTGNAFAARIEKRHAILDGFTNTNWLPGAEYRLPIAPVDSPVLTVVPGSVAYPPELSYPLQPRTDEPAVVLREKGKSRLAWFPGDIEGTMWRSGHTDLSRLLQNSIRWVAGGAAPVAIEGDGVIEAFAWETEAGFAVHILNYTNPNMHRGWIRAFYPIGPQKVRMKLPAGARVTRVELLRAESNVAFRVAAGAIEFTIPKVLDYEVAAIYSA